jgi:hypothetical protein
MWLRAPSPPRRSDRGLERNMERKFSLDYKRHGYGYPKPNLRAVLVLTVALELGRTEAVKLEEGKQTKNVRSRIRKQEEIWA